MRVQIKAAIVTATDTRAIRDDMSGAALAELLAELDAVVVERVVSSDDLDSLHDTILRLSERDDVNLILTTGGTGLSPRDNTPEATRAVIDREAPGIADAIRRETFPQTPLSMLSRAIAGTRNQTLIINLPGSPKAVRECFEVIRPVLQHAVDQLAGFSSH